MNLFARLPLRTKLRVVTGVLLLCTLLGSFLAWLKMQETSRLAADVALHQVPALQTLRDLRLSAIDSASALKSYLLFGSDPAAAARYHAQFQQGEQSGEAAIAAMDPLRDTLNDSAGSALLDTAVQQFRTLDADQEKVAALAYGQGNEATARAYDLLQTRVAQDDDRLSATLNTAVQKQVDTTSRSLAATAALSRAEALYMWIGVLLGGLLGLAASELTGRRIVSSVSLLASRARAIAEGDLTGGSVCLDCHDEIGQLAGSIDRMQQSLADMVAAMADTSATIHHDAGELSTVGAQAWKRTSDQSQQTHQAATAMQEMSITIAEVSGHAQSAADQARDAATAAREGGATVEEMLSGMAAISESVSQTAETVQRLGKESEQIIRIVNVIEEIAQKTNLLALNAAIEAARAGEQGRGFAVVAGEVRRLAESTRSATSEIAQMVDSITAHTAEAVTAMGAGTERVTHGMEITARAGESLRRIIAAADQVEAMIAQIATASTEQSIAAQEFSQNVEIISRIGEESVAATPVTKACVESIEADARRLREYIGRFRLRDAGSPARSAPSPALRPVSATYPVPAIGD